MLKSPSTTRFLVSEVRVPVEACVLPLSLLDGKRIEPPDDLGDQLSVVPGSLLDAEVRDVPGGDEQPVLRLRRDPARELVLPEMIDICADIVRVLELWLREGWHGELQRKLRSAGRNVRTRLSPVSLRPAPAPLRVGGSRLAVRRVRLRLRAFRTGNRGRSARLAAPAFQRPQMTFRLAPPRCDVRPVGQAPSYVSLPLA